MKYGLSLAKFACLAILFMAFAARPAQAVSFSDPAVDWQGLYAGLHLGATWGYFNNGLTKTGGNVSGGGQAGYNWQSGHLVIGAEGDLSGMRVVADGPTTNFNENWMATFRERAGYAFNRYLPYVTAGLALTGETWTVNGVGSKSGIRTGAAVGGGMDVMICDNWSVRGEYLYTDVPSQVVTIGGTGLAGGSSNHTLRAGVNYKFW
jgi:outer membrane immunogenic protein